MSTQNVARAVALMYSYPHLATDLKLDRIYKWATDYCGTKYRATLSSDSEKDTEINEGTRCAELCAWDDHAMLQPSSSCTILT